MSFNGISYDVHKLQLFNVGLLIVATIVAAKLIQKWVWARKTTPINRLPPVVKGRLPFIGGLLRFVKDPIKMLKEDYQRHGSVFTLNVLNKDITFLLEPEVSAHFFMAPESELSQREVYGFTVPIFGPGVFYDVDYSVRHQQIRFFEEAFRTVKLRSFVHDMLEEVQDYFSKWGESGETDFKEDMERLILLIASRCFFGHEVRDKLSDEIFTFMNGINAAMVPVTTMFPYLPIPAHRRRDNARKKLGDIFSNIIASRKSSSGKSDKVKDDTLQCLIDSKYKDGRATTVQEITGMLVTVLFGGQRTAAATSTWTAACLLNHDKKYWFAAVEEQKTLLMKHGNKVDYDVLTEMDVLYGCMKEVLRLYPPNSLILRQSHTDFCVTTRDGKKYDVPRGHIIAASPFFSNRLPYIYKDPDCYDPEKFVPERGEDKLGGPFSYTTFGGGKHGCLGQTFAYLMMKTVWTYLLRNFELELVSPFPEIERNDIVWGVKGKVMLHYKRRNLAID